jgi:hypothetical protein
VFRSQVLAQPLVVPGIVTGRFRPGGEGQNIQRIVVGQEFIGIAVTPKSDKVAGLLFPQQPGGHFFFQGKTERGWDRAEKSYPTPC